MSAMLLYDTGSYRDRRGRVFYQSGAVCRGLNADAFAEWNVVAGSRFFQQAMEAGRVVRTELASSSDNGQSVAPGEWAVVLRHELIPFISYPYEWTFGMLRDAALLHLELLDAALDEDITIKDGTAYNVQWRGARPVFIDIASFERLKPGEPWMGYRQFCQTFLYPLFLQAYKNVGFHSWLRGALDGIDPRDCAGLMSWRDWLRPGVLSHVVLHAKLHARYSQRETGVRAALPAAGFQKQMIKANVHKLLRIVRGLKWERPDSVWTGYATQNTYAEADHKRKVDFVRSVVQSRTWTLAWDLGCNTGTFSRIAAENADYVVAVDADHATVDRLYSSLKEEPSRRILPLVGNLADASPDQGWRGLERRSLRERGRPELILCLALIHHLVIGAGIPLPELVRWLADLKSDLIIEFVSREDPMVKLLLRNKPDDYSDYNEALFERLLSELFDLRRREPLESGTRTLYYAASKA